MAITITGTGPSTLRSFVFPDAAATILTSLSAAIGVPLTTSSTVGMFKQGVDPILHTYADPTATGRNLFLGKATGNFTLSPSGGAATLASYNVAVGEQALQSLTTGYFNVAMGVAALQLNTTGRTNVAVGYEPLRANTTGVENVALGADCLLSNTTGSQNTALGYDVLSVNITGTDNTGVGRQALFRSLLDRNVGVGSIALQHIVTADNVGIGFGAGTGIADATDERSTVDTRVVFVGNYAGRDGTIPTATVLTNIIAIGYLAKVAASNTAVLGNASITSTILRGTVSAPVLALGAAPCLLGAIRLTNAESIFGRKSDDPSLSYQCIGVGSGNTILLDQNNRGSVFGTTRPVTLDTTNGTIRVKGETGGWALAHGFSGSTGADLGGLWAFGTTNAITHWNIGGAYNDGFLTVTAAGAVKMAGALGGFAASDKYLVMDASGNIHKSALGPAS